MPTKDTPSILWGTFYSREGAIHIAPVIDTYLMYGHQLSEGCFCSPDVEYTAIKKVKMVIHHVVH